MTTFALFYGNRAFMPDEVIDEARPQLEKAVKEAGCDFISMDVGQTSHGAAETVREGKIYARVLEENKGKFDGVFACLAKFSDESAAVAALKDCGVPILIQACPDEIGKMDFAGRRDAFCGKLAITDLFYQYGIPFSLTQSHVVGLDSEEFKGELKKFGAVCRVVKNLRNLTVAAVGARVSAFKTMRFDELTAQKYGITVETVDLADFFLRMKSADPFSAEYKSRMEFYENYADCTRVPAASMDKMVRASLAADQVAAELETDCMTIRCWDEFQREMQISVCSLVSELNERGIVTACELDLANAICMKALSSASEQPAMCLDFNNNYGSEPDKCILFHCGPVCNTMMKDKGTIVEHKMFKKTMGDDVSWGVNQGTIRAMPMTYSSAKTDSGTIVAYVDNGEFVNDPIEAEYFGTGGVARIADLQKKLYRIAKNGFRHHVSVSAGQNRDALVEAYRGYLGFEVMDL